MITRIDHGAVQELRLNRPPVNALSTELISALREALERATAGSRAVVISGAPGMFTAGLDLPQLLTLDRDGMTRLWRELYALMKTLSNSPIPTCAAITGHAPAGGTVIALFCDWRVGARGDFKLGLTEVQAWIPLPPVILRALQRQVGARQAERLAVAGLMLSPEQAANVGLVDELASPEEVPERAVAWCRNMLALPAHAMSATRRLARADLTALFENPSEEELHTVLDNWWSEETQGTLRAMVARLGK
jgi:Delta3-Delta2-enoyl-CoA isomerase